MTDKLTVHNCMVGSVVWDNKNYQYRLCTGVDFRSGIRHAEYITKALITQDVLERCPLPNSVQYLWFPRDNVYSVSINNGRVWYGCYISDLQLYFRSIDLEWDLTKLFE